MKFLFVGGFVVRWGFKSFIYVSLFVFDFFNFLFFFVGEEMLNLIGYNLWK